VQLPTTCIPARQSKLRVWLDDRRDGGTGGEENNEGLELEVDELRDMVHHQN
jgi:hypothetical protein